MTDRGMLIVVSGPSGAGKDTVVTHYLENYSAGNAARSVSATTRAPRPGETNGESYFFITRDDFLERVSRGQMLEYAEYSGNCYGTPREYVDRTLGAGRSVILVIEVQGAANVRLLYPGAVLVFIMPPSVGELRRRLVARATEDEISLARRMETAEKEILRAREYDYVLTNDRFERCASDLDTVIRAAALSPKHNPYLTGGGL